MLQCYIQHPMYISEHYKGLYKKHKKDNGQFGSQLHVSFVKTNVCLRIRSFFNMARALIEFDSPGLQYLFMLLYIYLAS
jgi:hypothetical protein